MPEPTANELLRDALIRHQVGLMRLSSGIRKEVIKILNASEDDLRLELERRLNNMAKVKGVIKPATVSKLRFLEQALKDIRHAAIDKAYDVWSSQMKALVQQEAAFLQGAVKTVAPVTLEFVLPETTRLLSLVAKQPFEGKTLKQWASSLKKTDVDRIMSAVRNGIIQGEDTQRIVRRVIGGASVKGVNGVTELTRQNAATITRTAVNHFSNQAKQLTTEANRDIVSEELYVATLDSRTTPQCRALDGHRYPVGQGPRPPVHMNCRSVRVAIIDGQVIGSRPLKASTEKQLLREFSAKHNLGRVTDRDNLPHGTKGKFDAFARKRVRELTGTAPATETYQTFLAKQSVEFQNDVLGVTKAKLFRKGGMTLERFVDRNGDELTLKQLARRDRQAFIDAGLDPEDYL